MVLEVRGLEITSLNTYSIALLYYTGRYDKKSTRKIYKKKKKNSFTIYYSIGINYFNVHVVQLNLYNNTGLDSKTDQYRISVDFWNQTRTNKIKRHRELLSMSLELKRILILVKQYFIGTYKLYLCVNHR